MTQLGVADDLSTFLERRSLRAPDRLRTIFASPVDPALQGLLYAPRPGDEPGTMGWAERLIDESRWPLLPNLVPLLPIDERGRLR